MWKHPKYKATFKGIYISTKMKNGYYERTFVLEEQGKTKYAPKQISFESFQAAKKQGWVKS